MPDTALRIASRHKLQIYFVLFVWLLLMSSSYPLSQNLYRPRSSSTNSVDETLSEKEETRQNVTPTHHYSYTSEESTQAEEPLEESQKVTLLTASPRSPLNKATEPIQHEDKPNTVSSVEITVLHASNHTREPLAKEPSNDNKINVNEDQASLIPLSICSLDTASDYIGRKERTDSSFAASSIDQMESPKSPIDLDVSKPLENITRLHPVPVPVPVPTPRTKTPTLPNLNKGPPKVSGLKPVEAEKDTPSSSGLAESPREDDKPLRPSSFRFSIASAKYRSKTSDENVAKQDEENTQKSQSYNQNLVVQMEKVENNEACRNIPSAPDKRNSLVKDIVVQNVSKTGVVDNPEKSEGCTQNTDYLKAEEPEDRRGLFGVKLRSTSLCLKYRSELPRSEAEMKQNSLEGEHILAIKEAVSSDMEAIGNDRKANVQQSLDIQQDPSLDKGTSNTPCV